MIGLFLGNRNLPKLIVKSLNKKKINYFIIDLTSKNIFKKNKNSYFINIGKFGKILNLIKSKMQITKKKLSVEEADKLISNNNQNQSKTQNVSKPKDKEKSTAKSKKISKK